MNQSEQKKTIPAGKRADEKKAAPADTKSPWDIDIQACSATDCTGLIPALPQSEAELQHYEELYPFMAKAESKKDS